MEWSDFIKSTIADGNKQIPVVYINQGGTHKNEFLENRNFIKWPPNAQARNLFNQSTVKNDGQPVVIVSSMSALAVQNKGSPTLLGAYRGEVISENMIHLTRISMYGSSVSRPPRKRNGYLADISIEKAPVFLVPSA